MLADPLIGILLILFLLMVSLVLFLWFILTIRSSRAVAIDLADLRQGQGARSDVTPLRKSATPVRGTATAAKLRLSNDQTRGLRATAKRKVMGAFEKSETSSAVTKRPAGFSAALQGEKLDVYISDDKAAKVPSKDVSPKRTFEPEQFEREPFSDAKPDDWLRKPNITEVEADQVPLLSTVSEAVEDIESSSADLSNAAPLQGVDTSPENEPDEVDVYKLEAKQSETSAEDESPEEMPPEELPAHSEHELTSQEPKKVKWAETEDAFERFIRSKNDDL